eukprot:353187-Chlamydomonas_euryale.AAC.1
MWGMSGLAPTDPLSLQNVSCKRQRAQHARAGLHVIQLVSTMALSATGVRPRLTPVLCLTPTWSMVRYACQRSGYVCGITTLDGSASAS